MSQVNVYKRQEEVAVGAERYRYGGQRVATAQPTVAARGAACTAAAIDAGLAVASDLVSLTGFGMVATKGTRGARVAIKLLRATEWLVKDRVTGALMPGNSRSMHSIANWGAASLVGLSWRGVSAAVQDQGFDLGTELLSLIPGVNAGMALVNATQKCFFSRP